MKGLFLFLLVLYFPLCILGQQGFLTPLQIIEIIAHERQIVNEPKLSVIMNIYDNGSLNSIDYNPDFFVMQR